MQRPTGVTILAVLSFIGAGLELLGALGFLLVGAGFAAEGLASDELGGAAAFLLGLGIAFGVVLLVFAGIGAAIGIGLWKLRNWGRVLAIVFSSFALLVAAVGLVVSVISFDLAGLISQVIVVGLYAWILWYLFQPHVKQAFGAS